MAKSKGNCEVCGKKKTTVANTMHGLACSICQNLSANVNRRPALVIELMQKIHGAKYFPASNEQSSGSGDSEVARDILKRVYEALQYEGKINDMPQRIRELVAENESLKSQVENPPVADKGWTDAVNQVQEIIGILEGVIDLRNGTVEAVRNLKENRDWLQERVDKLEPQNVELRAENSQLMAEKSDHVFASFNAKSDNEMLAGIIDLLGDAGFGPDESPVEAVLKLIESKVGTLEETTDGYQTPSGYEKLMAVMVAAVDQAANGKGKERHAVDGVPFELQQMCRIARDNGVAYAIGQAIKKAEESQRLGSRGPAELLGAMNFLAGAHIVMSEKLNGDSPYSDLVQKFRAEYSPFRLPAVEYQEGVGHD